MVLIRLETADGLIGWGEAFSYNCRRAVTAAFEDMVAPAVQGRDVTDIADQAAIDHHMETPYMKEYMADTGPMIANRNRTLCSLASE